MTEWHESEPVREWLSHADEWAAEPRVPDDVEQLWARLAALSNEPSLPGESHAPQWPDTDMVGILARQREFSDRTFGPGQRTAGLLAHIRKELAEIEAAPLDLEEWIDVAILAFDGAGRTGASASEIVRAYVTKLATNEAREWPDWRGLGQDQPIEHVRIGGDQ